MNNNFDSGVQSYVVGTATVKVHFPIDKKGNVWNCCEYCSYLSSNNRMCQLNKKPVFFYKTNIGDNCPLNFELEEK